MTGNGNSPIAAGFSPLRGNHDDDDGGDDTGIQMMSVNDNHEEHDSLLAGERLRNWE